MSNNNSNDRVDIKEKLIVAIANILSGKVQMSSFRTRTMIIFFIIVLCATIYIASGVHTRSIYKQKTDAEERYRVIKTDSDKSSIAFNKATLGSFIEEEVERRGLTIKHNTSPTVDIE